jgi:hypothetical protein
VPLWQHCEQWLFITKRPHKKKFSAYPENSVGNIYYLVVQATAPLRQTSTLDNRAGTFS